MGRLALPIASSDPANLARLHPLHPLREVKLARARQRTRLYHPKREFHEYSSRLVTRFTQASRRGASQGMTGGGPPYINESLTLTRPNEKSIPPRQPLRQDSLTPIKSHAIPDHPVWSLLRLHQFDVPPESGATGGPWARRESGGVRRPGFGWGFWIASFRILPIGWMPRGGCRFRHRSGPC